MSFDEAVGSLEAKVERWIRVGSERAEAIVSGYRWTVVFTYERPQDIASTVIATVKTLALSAEQAVRVAVEAERERLLVAIACCRMIKASAVRSNGPTDSTAAVFDVTVVMVPEFKTTASRR